MKRLLRLAVLGDDLPGDRAQQGNRTARPSQLVQTGRRILEHEVRALRRSRCMARTALLEKIEFGLQHVQQVSIVVCHDTTPCPALCRLAHGGQAVGDERHSRAYGGSPWTIAGGFERERNAL